MDDSFEVLEQKVRTAAETVRRLRKENKAFSEDADRTKLRLQEAQKRIAVLEKDHGAGADQARQVERLTGELDGLRKERQEVKSRIAKLVEVLEELE